MLLFIDSGKLCQYEIAGHRRPPGSPHLKQALFISPHPDPLPSRGEGVFAGNYGISMVIEYRCFVREASSERSLAPLGLIFTHT